MNNSIFWNEVFLLMNLCMILAFVIFKVLLKIVEKVNVNYHLEVPESIECDTTSGNDGSVYVKYDDYNFYPEYIVYYNDDDDYYFYD